MRVSYEWLKSMVDVPADPAELVAELTRTGTEVESVEKVGANLEHVVTAQVVSKKPHPDSDHMWLCQVSVGDKNVDENGNPVPLQIVCGGKGCRFCKGTGWLEILGAGMVDPNVLEYCGIDSERYTGFAFGMGVERIACLRYDLPDLRMLMTGDMRFLRQF